MTTQQQTHDPDDVLMGGGAAPAWKFNEPGTTRTGTILSKTTRQERDYDKDNPGGGDLKYFPSGDPIMGIVIEVATDERDAGGEDDGKRTFYIEGQHLKAAVRDAVKATGSQKLEIGGRVTVTFTHREDPTDRRSRKYWNVVYTLAADNALHQGQQAQPPAAPPVAPSPAAQPQFVQTPQGIVNTATGELVQPAVPPPSQPPAAPPVAPPAQPAAAGPEQPDPAAIAALRAANVDPKTVYPHYTG